MDWEHIGYTRVYCESNYGRQTTWDSFPIYVKVINGAVFFAIKYDDAFYIVNHQDYYDHYHSRQVKNEYFIVGDREYIVVDLPHVVGFNKSPVQSKNDSSK